ncbi:hypothetical protein ACET3Z_027643 [Daucus carota]
MAKKLKLEHDQSKCYDYFQNLTDDLMISIFTKLMNSSSSSDKNHGSHVGPKVLGRCTTVCKRFNALACPVIGKTCFEKLPDQLVMCIFTKLSSNDDEKYDSLGDLKALGRCSSISKRFNSLVSLVPSLSINHPSIYMLYKYCPLILNKFKHIRALQITHWSRTAAVMRDQNKSIPLIVWEASYRPHSYFLAVVSYKNIFSYAFKDPKSFMLPDSTPKDDEYHESIWSDIEDMFCLHHMLVSSIKDHTFLQRVVVTDFNRRGTLTLEEDMLAELRNCSPRNQLEHVLVSDRSGSAINLDVPGPNKFLGLMLNDVCFSILEWWENPMHDHDPIPKDEDVSGIPAHLQKGWLVQLLRILLKDPAMVEVNDSTDILQLFGGLKSDGYLI